MSDDDTTPEPDTSEQAKPVEPAAKPKRHHPTVAEVRALQAKIEELQAKITELEARPAFESLIDGRIEALEARAKDQTKTIAMLLAAHDRTKTTLAARNELIAKLEAKHLEEGYWESQWRNEAAAREWAEAKLYERKAKADAG
jgi:hypothetical protein